jgi:hypothetical protein
LVKSGNKISALRRLLVLELFLFELFVLLFMEVYKYYINSSSRNLLSKEFLRELLGSFSIFYAGNLIWFILFFISLISLIGIYYNLDKISEASLKLMMFFTIILLALLTFSVFLPGSESLDNFSRKFIQLNTKATKTIGLTFFAIFKIFQTISLCVISL